MTGQTIVDIHPFGKALGAEIRGVDLSEPQSTELLEQIRAAWLDNLVLLFRKQALTDDDLVNFSRYFGYLDMVPGWEPFSPAGHHEVLVASNVQEDGIAIC